MTEIQYMSDLHLELYPGFRIENITASFLVLAGDIGDPDTFEYFEFMNDVSTKYEKVFIVLGNHEYYGKTIMQTLTKVNEILSNIPKQNVILLDRTGYDIIPGELRIIGATLWSHIPPINAYDIQCFIQDFRRIKDMSITEYNNMHLQDVSWIEVERILAEINGINLIVVTHHAPIRNINPKHANSSLNSAFNTDLEYIIQTPILAWIYGHTHFSNTRNINGVQVVSNQRGYVDEGVVFDLGKTLQVKV